MKAKISILSTRAKCRNNHPLALPTTCTNAQYTQHNNTNLHTMNTPTVSCSADDSSCSHALSSRLANAKAISSPMIDRNAMLTHTNQNTAVSPLLDCRLLNLFLPFSDSASPPECCLCNIPRPLSPWLPDGGCMSVAWSIVLA